MARSYAQMASAIMTTLKANPDMGSTAIVNHYQASPQGAIKRADMFPLIKSLRQVTRFSARIDNSDAKPGTRARVLRESYQNAKRETPRGRAEYRKGLSEKRRAEFDRRGKLPTAKEIEDRMFKNHPDREEYVEFYL